MNLSNLKNSFGPSLLPLEEISDEKFYCNITILCFNYLPL